MVPPSVRARSPARAANGFKSVGAFGALDLAGLNETAAKQPGVNLPKQPQTAQTTQSKIIKAQAATA